MKYLFIFFIGLLTHTAGLAQLDGFDGFSNLKSANSYMFRSFDNRYEGVQGYPTVLENFVSGSVITKNGVEYKNVQINFDAYQNELIALDTRLKKPVIVNAKEIDSFILVSPVDKSLISFKKITVDNKVFYAQVICDGTNKLYKQPIKKLVKANYSGAYNQSGNRFDEFVETFEFYLQADNNEPIKLGNSKKSISKAIPSLENEITKWMSADKTNPKSEADLKRLVEHLNAI